MVTSYAEFLDSKRRMAPAVGPVVDPGAIHESLFDFQRYTTAWALRRGRAAIFADAGLGKTRMQVEWARLIGVPTLIVAPLAVVQQTVREAQAIGVDLRYARTPGDAAHLTITNYEMVDRFDPSEFGAVVLDESSILKNVSGPTRLNLTRQWSQTPFRLACSATPAPNDVAEMCNHAEFLGILSRGEMLSAYFVHDEDGWRLKGHASESMYSWMATWATAMRRPLDLGFTDHDADYDLPALSIMESVVDADVEAEGQLFATDLGGISGRHEVRRSTMSKRIVRAAALTTTTTDQWIIWCGLNDEARGVAKWVADAVNVEGSWTPEAKADAFLAFTEGRIRVLVTKASIAGWGMNFQNCHRMAFVGLSDSYEAYYQSIRRCWRFGQSSPVDVHIIVSDLERQIVANVRRKESEANETTDALLRHCAARRARATVEEHPYVTDDAEGSGWRLMLGDSCERLAEIPDESVDLSIYSPPFASLFTYSPSDRDLGNSPTTAQFVEHYAFVIGAMLRVTKPGRISAVHVQQIATQKVRDGAIGIEDFRGAVIAAHRAAGWIFHGEVTVWKNPQAQAVRTKAQSLLFVTLRRDSAISRPAFADYVLMFRKPGDNAVPILPDVDNETWIEWASPVWWGIRESDTLNASAAREDADERHICPLQLSLIERCVRLWSNKGETVLSPFAGIGSEGYEALRHRRRFVGIELKPSYWTTAIENLRRAEYEAETPMLFGDAAS